jgi:nucleoside 2-deoxyribosyltransferase
MNKPKIYLAGAKSEQKYRNYIKEVYGHIFDIKDPFVEVDHNESNESIVRNDISLITKCDMLIAYINKITVGTTMEIYHAYNIGKSVYIITTPELEKDIWLSHYSTKIYNDIDVCMINALNNFGINYIHKEQNNGRKWKVVIEEDYLKEKGEKMNKTETLNMGKEANVGFTRDDSKTSTRLLDKQWSPAIIRKYYVSNWPCYVGLITDCNLNDLDKVVHKVIDEAEKHGFLDGNIQSCRNFCGFLSDKIDEHYDNIKKGSVEGIAIAWYVDKCFISSLSKDFMVHKSCRDEFYSILKILPHI